MRNPTWALAIAIPSIVLIGGSCAKSPRGTSRMEILGIPEAQGTGRGKVREAQAGTEEIDYIAAVKLSSMEQPSYPDRLLATGPATLTITVLVTISQEGRVSDITKSWKGSMMNSDATIGPFLETIEAAASSWRFQAARQVYYRRTETGEREYLRTEIVSETVEMRFTFEKSSRK